MFVTPWALEGVFSRPVSVRLVYEVLHAINECHAMPTLTYLFQGSTLTVWRVLLLSFGVFMGISLGRYFLEIFYFILDSLVVEV